MRSNKIKNIVFVISIIYTICSIIYIILHKERKVEMELVAKLPSPKLERVSGDLYMDVWWSQIENLSRAEYFHEDSLIRFAEKWNFENDGYLIISWGKELVSLSYQMSSLKALTPKPIYTGYPIFCGNSSVSDMIYIYRMPNQPNLQLYTQADSDVNFHYDRIEWFDPLESGD